MFEVCFFFICFVYVLYIQVLFCGYQIIFILVVKVYKVVMWIFYCVVGIDLEMCEIDIILDLLGSFYRYFKI